MKRLRWILLGIFAGCLSAGGQLISITNFNPGEIEWVVMRGGERCTVQWSSSPDGEWHDGWNPGNIVATGETSRAQIPMLFRVVSHGLADTNLYGIYRFNGNALDQGGAARHAVCEGPRLTNDMYDTPLNAYWFWGDDLVRIEVPSLTNGYSISMWFNAEELYGEPKLFSRDYVIDGGGQENLRVNAQTQLQYYISQRAAVATNVLETGTWYHVATTYDLTNALIYLNGIQVAATQTLTSSVINDDIMIGCHRWEETTGEIGVFEPTHFDNGFMGRIDEVGVWTRPLESNEVWDVFQWGL